MKTYNHHHHHNHHINDQELFVNPQMIKMVVTNTVHQVHIYNLPKPICSRTIQTLQQKLFFQGPFKLVINKKFQDYSNCHESITEKLVVIDVSDVIGEAIRYLVL